MIVITGLDGSGKSTLLDKLAKKARGKVAILRVPTIDAELFSEDETLYKLCLLINESGAKADLENQPSLKIIAMFGAVLLYGELHDHLLKKGNKTVFCERHPLIDTGVYARAYLKVMHPDLLDATFAADIEKRYPEEMKELLKRVNATIPASGRGMCYDLLTFLHAWFAKDDNYSVEHLQDLFSIQKPDIIYFLDAPASLLFSRLESREVKEYHESELALEKMRSLYLKFLPQLETPYQIIDVADFTNADALYNKLLSQIE